MVQGGCGEGNSYGYVVGTCRVEGRFPTFNQGEEGFVCKGEIYDLRASFAH